MCLFSLLNLLNIKTVLSSPSSQSGYFLFVCVFQRRGVIWTRPYLSAFFGTTVWVVQGPAPNGERGLKQKPNKSPTAGGPCCHCQQGFPHCIPYVLNLITTDIPDLKIMFARKGNVNIGSVFENSIKTVRRHICEKASKLKHKCMLLSKMIDMTIIKCLLR